MRFTYPAQLQRTGVDEIVVSFRDLPECLTSGADETEALAEAADALEEAIAGRIDDRESIPYPSTRRAGEHLVTVPADTAVKAALALALRETGTTRVALAARLGIDEKAVRRMLDPRHRSSANRIHEACGRSAGTWCSRAALCGVDQSVSRSGQPGWRRFRERGPRRLPERWKSAAQRCADRLSQCARCLGSWRAAHIVALGGEGRFGARRDRPPVELSGIAEREFRD